MNFFKKYFKPCNLFFYSEEEIRRKILKRNYSDDSEVTENLQKKQRMALATGDYMHIQHSSIHTHLLPGSKDTINA